MTGKLTSREEQICVLVAAGCGNREICTRLNISPGTVSKHVSSILNKTGSPNRTLAVVTLLIHGHLNADSILSATNKKW